MKERHGGDAFHVFPTKEGALKLETSSQTYQHAICFICPESMRGLLVDYVGGTTDVTRVFAFTVTLLRAHCVPANVRSRICPLLLFLKPQVC